MLYLVCRHTSIPAGDELYLLLVDQDGYLPLHLSFAQSTSLGNIVYGAGAVGLQGNQYGVGVPTEELL
jgi:hypothetical protein